MAVLLDTSTFEGGFDGWARIATNTVVDLSTEKPRSGSQSLRFRTSSSVGERGVRRTYTGLVVGEEYTFGVWMASSNTTYNHSFTISVYDGSTPVAGSPDYDPSGSAYYYRDVTFTATNTSMRIEVEAYVNGTNRYIYVDDAALYGPEPTPSTTPVDATPVSSTWNVLETIFDTQVTEWDIRTVVSDSQATSWDVAAPILSVSQTVSTLWDVRSAISDSETTTWTVSEKVSDSQATSWAVLTPLTASSPSTTFAVRSKLALAAPVTSWTVYSVISDSQATIWDVRTKVSDSESTLWGIRTSLSDSQATTWDILSKVSESNTDSWNIFTTVADKTIFSAWSVDAPAVTYKNSAQGGVQGAQVVVSGGAAGGDPFSLVTGTVYYTGNVGGANGSTMAFESQSAAGVHSIGWQDLNGGTGAALRSYVYLTSYPTSTNYIHRLGNGSSTQGWSGITTTGILVSRFEGSGSTSIGTTPIPLKTWVRIETLTNTVAGSTASAWFYGGSSVAEDSVFDTDTPTSALLTQGAVGKLLFAANNPVNFDDIAFRINATQFIGPEGGVVVIDSGSSTWSVRSLVTDDATTTWDVRQAVTDAQTTSWAVYGALSKTQATTWDVTGKLVDSISTEWDVYNLIQVEDSVDTSWTVYSKVSDEQPTEWGVRSSLTDSQATSWNVYVPIASPKTTSTLWGVKALVQDDMGTSWGIGGRVQDDMATTWDTRAKMSDSQVTTWGVRVKTPVDMVWDVWNVYRSTTPKTVYTDWDVRELVSDEITTLWRIGGALRVYRSKSTLGGSTGASSAASAKGNGIIEGQSNTSAVLSDSAMEAALGGTTSQRTLTPYEFIE